MSDVHPIESGKVRWRIVTTLLPLACLAAASCAPGQTTTFSPDRQARIESAISKFMAASNAPGVSVAVVQGREFVWSGGFGMADLENSVPATADTLYRLGSVSKPITAIAALVLSERGRLDLDAPIQKYCPAFPQKPWPITTRQLLGIWGEFAITAFLKVRTPCRRRIQKWAIPVTSKTGSTAA